MIVKVKNHIAETDNNDAFVIAKHGYLWMYQRPFGGAQRDNDDAQLHWYKAVATGKEHLWYDYELEKGPHDEE